MKNQDNILLEICLDNPDAVSFIELLARISQTWDDLIDKDNKVSDDDISKMMWLALIDLNENRFFLAHTTSILPIMKQAIINWLNANDYEQDYEKKMLKVSYIKRSVITDIAIHVAYLVGGFDHSRVAGKLIEQAVFEDDSYSEYLKEQKQAHTNREVENVVP